MDFGALLHYAKKKNDAATKDEEGKYYSTKYAPPKKESKESKQLSNNIQKFLKKREEEESERKRQEREKLSNLLAMRDEKSKNKIRKMLKVTKSANKSVLEDAKDCDNTAVTLGGPDQPDGDDYGYVSTEANAFYQKYIEKVKDVHEDKGFAPSRPQSLRDLSGTKERVKAAITREREEAKTHTRQRLSTSSTAPRDPSVARSYTSSKTLYNPEAERREAEAEEEKKKPKVKRPPQPPPMDFQALLRLAEQKQHEPITIAMPEKKKEPERLLSAREKREQEERQRWKEQRAQRERARETEAKNKEQRKESSTTASSAAAASQPRMEPNGRIPKLNKTGGSTVKAAPAAAAAQESKAKPTSDSLKRPATTAASGSSSGPSAKISANNNTKSSSSSNGSASASASVSASKRPATKSTAGAGAVPAAASSSKPQSRNPYAAAAKTGATREFPPREQSVKTRAFPPKDVARRPAPPGADARGRAGQPMSRKQQQHHSEMANKRRIYDEDDSEYDSELDDFIDDGDCEEDISSHIRDIFGYDKRRYRDLDEDDDQMESSFAQVQREELISKKLGLQEDLEDMRMEALHKKNKMAKKRTKRLDDDDDDD